MLNQLLKFTLISSLLMWLKPRWKSLLALTIAVGMVHVLHGEYLEYVQLSGNDAYLVWSYVIKWLVLLLVAGIYLAYLTIGTKPKPKPQRVGKFAIAASQSQEAVGETPSDDGFDFLRRKRQLESRADKVIEAGGRRR